MSTTHPSLALVSGPEEILAERAIASLLEQVRAADPTTEVVRIDPEGYEPGALIVHASPSLFGGGTCIVVRGLDVATDDLQQDLLDYLKAPDPSVTLIVRHRKGNKGKRVLDALKKQGAHVTACDEIKYEKDKLSFVTGEFRRAGRRAEAEAVQAIVDALGNDVSEMASACAQLVQDTEGLVTAQMVEQYHGGRVEATGFKVAEAAISGNAAEALRMLRHALDTGSDPVPIVGALAGQLRQTLRVGSAGRGSDQQLAKALGMHPFQVKKARAALSGWSGDALGDAIQAVAAADAEVKGGGRDPVYAVERAILAITRARASERS